MNVSRASVEAIRQIRSFDHVRPLEKIDITVGLQLPRVGETTLNQRTGKVGDRVLGREFAVDPPPETEFPLTPRPRDKGWLIDITA